MCRAVAESRITDERGKWFKWKAKHWEETELSRGGESAAGNGFRDRKVKSLAEVKTRTPTKERKELHGFLGRGEIQRPWGRLRVLEQQQEEEAW